MPATYKTETLRAQLRADLALITGAPDYSFAVAEISDGERDPDTLATPAVTIREVAGSTDPDALGQRAGLSVVTYELDLYARDGDVVSLERAVTDIRNVLEVASSNLVTVGKARNVVAVAWELLEGSEFRRAAIHRARVTVEVGYAYVYGSG